jgi:hypothetical protein
MESTPMLLFVFTGKTLDGALEKLLDHMKDQKLDGYHVVDVVVHLVTVYWRVVVYCLAEPDRGDKATLSFGQHGPVDHPPEALSQ